MAMGGMARLGDEMLDPRRNNFTAVRLLLASLVIVTHVNWRVTGSLDEDALSGVLGAPLSTFAVDGFFFLSGFLTFPSLGRLGRPSRFLLARLVRIWPALAVSVLLTALLGFFATADPAGYWRGDTARFVGGLSLLKAGYYLTGVECGGARCLVNGSLWTLPWEARCYLLLAALGWAGLAAPRAMGRFVLPAALLGSILWIAPPVQDAARALLGDGRTATLAQGHRLLTMFALGVAAHLFRDRLPLSWPALLALLAAYLVACRFGEAFHLRALFTGYLVLCLGLLTARRRAVSADWPDYSYGVYIYAFPLMVALHELLPGSGEPGLALLNLLAVLPLAALSWHLVEKPALDRFRARRRRVAAPA